VIRRCLLSSRSYIVLRMTIREAKKDKGWISFFYSVKFTILLLLLLAVLSIIGTLIPQNATEQEYLRRYSKETYYIFKGFGLLDMYHSWWFVGVLILLAVNLTACSLKRLPSTWRQLRQTKKDYARLGVYVTHLSILLILVAGLIGALWGLRGHVTIEEGETVTEMILDDDRGARLLLGFGVRCDAFKVDFYPDGSPKEYVSTLTFTEGDAVTLDQVRLRVNHPITYRGLTFYQASYGLSTRSSHILVGVTRGGGSNDSRSLQLTRGSIQPIPGTQDRIGFMKYVERAGDMGEAVMLVLFSPASPPTSFWLFRRISESGGQRVKDYTFTLKDIKKKYYTGLQVTRDPGVPFFWLGCALLVVGLIVTFMLRRPERRQPAEHGEV